MIKYLNGFRLVALMSLSFSSLMQAQDSPQQKDLKNQNTFIQKGSPTFVRTGAAPMFDFGGVQADIQSKPTEVLVLGTVHLAQMSEKHFDKSHLSIVLEKIQNFSPDVIAVEAVNGRTCDEITRYKSLYPDVQGYCFNNKPALEQLGMSRPESAAALEQVLRKWPKKPTSSDRRRLALLFLGAGEVWSGVLQWSKLSKDERIAKDGLSEQLVAKLNKGLNSQNENNLIGVELARRLDLDELAMIDDHTADYIYLNSPEELWSTVQAVWNSEHPKEKEMKDRQQQFWRSAEQVKDGYLFLNSKEYQRFVIENDFGLATANSDGEGRARQYVAWWQVRGLRMAANLLEAAGNKPGAKVLVIVGASHKSYFDLYLDQMHDIEIVDIKEVLTD